MTTANATEPTAAALPLATPAQTGEAIAQALYAIREFCLESPFRAVLDEFWGLSSEERPDFVLEVLLNDAMLRERGVERPADLIIQRSAFRDNRPSMFCVTKYLSPGLKWTKVTITFDNPDGDPAIDFDRTLHSGAAFDDLVH